MPAWWRKPPACFADYLTQIMHNNLFQPNACLSEEETLQFAFGSPDDALRYRVEAHILDCPLCATAVEGMLSRRQMGHAQAQAELKSLRSAMARRTNQAPPIRLYPSFNRVVAGVLLLLGFFSVWMYWNHTRNERLFAGYFHPVYRQYLIFRNSPDTTSPKELEEAMAHYEARDFAGSLPYFSHYLKENPTDYKVAFLAGISALEVGENEKAGSLLESVRFNFPDLYEEATWYLALTRLRTRQTKECMELLEELSASNAPEWSNQAAALLSELSHQ